MLRTALAGALGLTAFVNAIEAPSTSSIDIIENVLEGASLLSLAVSAPKRNRKLPLSKHSLTHTALLLFIEETKIQEFKSTTVPCQYWWDNKWYDLTSFDEN